MVRWGAAERPIAQFVAQGNSDIGFIDKHIDQLLKQNPDTEFKQQNRDLCVGALKSFKLLSNQLDFTKFSTSLGPTQKSLPVPISGVDVSVLPQVLLQGITKNGTRIVGGVKFSFPKTYPLDGESAAYLSVLVHWHCEYHLAPMGRADLRLCRAIDVPTATAFAPPKSYKRKRQQLEEACNEITQRWPNVPPPDDSDD